MKNLVSARSDDEAGVVVYTDTREDLAKLGLSSTHYDLIQHWFTWITGKPYKAQPSLFPVSRAWHLLTALTSLFGGVIASAVIFKSSFIFYPFLILSWAFTVGGGRKLQTMIIHRCVHKQFWGISWRDLALAEVLSTVLLIQDYGGYRFDHVKLHHRTDVFATEKDPDFDFLLKLKFQPGLTRTTADT